MKLLPLTVFSKQQQIKEKFPLNYFVFPRKANQIQHPFHIVNHKENINHKCKFPCILFAHGVIHARDNSNDDTLEFDIDHHE